LGFVIHFGLSISNKSFLIDRISLHLSLTCWADTSADDAITSLEMYNGINPFPSNYLSYWNNYFIFFGFKAVYYSSSLTISYIIIFIDSLLNVGNFQISWDALRSSSFSNSEIISIFPYIEKHHWRISSFYYLLYY
jgi:hypothetical protein